MNSLQRFCILALWCGSTFCQESPVTQLTSDVYLFRHGFHSNMFVVTPEGVAVTDPISPTAAEACLAEIRKISDAPIKYVIYSHDHTDHVAGGAAFGSEATVVAHRNAAAAIRARGLTEIVAPDLLVDDSHTIRLGAKAIELTYFGRIESSSNLAIYVPQDKVLMWVDVVRSFGVPYRYLEGSDLRDLRQALKDVSTWDIEHVVPGHGPATDKKRVKVFSAYFDDLERHAVAQMGRHSQLEHRDHAGDMNPEKYFDSYISETAKQVVEDMRPHYGELGGFDDWGPKNAERMVVYLLHELPFGY